tara:strand:- start:121699 stop:121911 length:213 start_codon:yes stop_codon:yes gene_type:complete
MKRTAFRLRIAIETSLVETAVVDYRADVRRDWPANSRWQLTAFGYMNDFEAVNEGYTSSCQKDAWTFEKN